MLVFQSLLRGAASDGTCRGDYPFWETRRFRKRRYPLMYFVEQRYAHDPTNWWIPNRACAEAMLRSAGFEIVDASRRRSVHLPTERGRRRG